MIVQWEPADVSGGADRADSPRTAAIGLLSEVNEGPRLPRRGHYQHMGAKRRGGKVISETWDAYRNQLLHGQGAATWEAYRQIIKH